MSSGGLCVSYRNGNDVYRNNQILSASPKRLIELLIEGAIKSIKIAELALPKNDFETVNKQLVKAQDIVLELQQAVNPAVDQELGEQLIQMYEFMFEKLVQANLTKDPATLELVRKMLEELAETWGQL